MNLIGSGAQYYVYDTHNGRVLKHPLTHNETFVVIKSWPKTSDKLFATLPDDYTTTAIKSNQYIKKIINKNPELARSLGNPIFISTTSYTQDKVQTLGDFLAATNLEHGKLIINAYTELIITHWRYGFSDNVFNFTINNGVNAQGKVILLDFGEVSFNKTNVTRRIINKQWLSTWCYLENCPETIKDYYADKMNSDINLNRLNETWKNAL